MKGKSKIKKPKLWIELKHEESCSADLILHYTCRRRVSEFYITSKGALKAAKKLKDMIENTPRVPIIQT